MHLLVSYRQACHDVARSRDDAAALARELLTRVQRGADLSELARERSDEPFGRARAGRLTLPADLGASPFGDLGSLPADGTAVLRESVYGFHLLQRLV